MKHAADRVKDLQLRERQEENTPASLKQNLQ